MTESAHSCLPGEYMLRLQGIHKRFFPIVALADVSFTLRPGEIHALVGENGAGKSTLVKIIAGVESMDAGKILLNGGELFFANPADSLAAGIKVVFQELELMNDFTVAENIFMENHPRNRFGVVNWREIREQAKALFTRAGFDLDADEKISRLSIGQQQMVEIAHALASAARVVVLDEPTSSLTPQEVGKLFSILRTLRAQGLGIIYVSHKLEEIFALSDRITVLRDGRWVFTRATASHTRDSLIHDMVGREITTLFPHQRPLTALERAPLLAVEGVSTKDKLRQVSFIARRGEVVGFFGLLGAGRSE